MKIIFSKKRWCSFPILLAIGAILASSAYCGIDKTTGLPIQTTNSLDVSLQDILNSVQMPRGNAEKTQSISYQYNSQKREFINGLLKTLQDSKASNLNRSMAAYYLGEAHAVEAVNALTDNIGLKVGVEPTSFSGLPLVSGFTACSALIKIGNPSIPPMIRNLAESDNAKVRELSLQVIERIDNDKDISALRLQKALKAETDSKKQARLQAALKALTGK
jgi:HEAT repeat protein